MYYGITGITVTVHSIEYLPRLGDLDHALDLGSLTGAEVQSGPLSSPRTPA